jgi:hypothetical protein
MKFDAKNSILSVVRALASLLFGVFTLVALILLADALFFRGPGPKDGSNMFLSIIFLPISISLIPFSWFVLGRKILRIPIAVGAMVGLALVTWVAYGFMQN